VVTAAILVLCLAAFGWELAVMAGGGEDALNGMVERWGLIPADLVAALSAGDLLSLPVLTVFTHMFLHGSWLHLMGNMLFLWIFAVNVEDRLGRVLFIALYLVGGLAAATGHVMADPTSELPMVGASGAISAVLGAYLVLFPRARIQSLVFLVFFYELIAVPSVLVLGFWFVLQLVDGLASLGLTDQTGGAIAFWAHIGGFAAGAAIALPLRRLRPALAPVPAPGPPLPPPPPRA
jgi:membrane associated rhomboid family serine protease